VPGSYFSLIPRNDYFSLVIHHRWVVHIPGAGQS